MSQETERLERCDTCINVRGSNHFSPHAWCNLERAFFEKDHSCGQWGVKDGC